MPSKKRPTPHPFGKVVVAAREAKGWSRYELIKRSGHSASQLYALEKGHGEPTLGTMLWVAEALEMDPRDLFNSLYQAMMEEGDQSDDAQKADAPSADSPASAHG